MLTMMTISFAEGRPASQARLLLQIRAAGETHCWRQAAGRTPPADDFRGRAGSIPV